MRCLVSFPPGSEVPCVGGGWSIGGLGAVGGLGAGPASDTPTCGYPRPSDLPPSTGAAAAPDEGGGRKQGWKVTRPELVGLVGRCEGEALGPLCTVTLVTAASRVADDGVLGLGW